MTVIITQRLLRTIVELIAAVLPANAPVPTADEVLEVTTTIMSGRRNWRSSLSLAQAHVHKHFRHLDNVLLLSVLCYPFGGMRP